MCVSAIGKQGARGATKVVGGGINRLTDTDPGSYFNHVGHLGFGCDTRSCTRSYLVKVGRQGGLDGCKSCGIELIFSRFSARAARDIEVDPPVRTEFRMSVLSSLRAL